MDPLTGEPSAADSKEEVRREQRRFREQVAAKEARLRKFRRRGDKGFWPALASFGMVGWSIAVPTVLGVAIGSWLDRRLGGGIRYTLSLMILGLAIGTNNAWRWIKLQEAEVLREETDPDGAEEPRQTGPPEAGGDAP